LSFTVSYNIKATDQFTSVAKKVEEAFERINKKMSKMNVVFKQSANAQQQLFTKQISAAKKFESELLKVQQRMESLQRQSGKGVAFTTRGGGGAAPTGVSGMGMASMAGRFLPTAAAGYMAYQGAQNTARTVFETEDALAALSAQNRITGESLEYLRDQAFQSGAKLGQTGVAMIDMFRVTASAIPELMAKGKEKMLADVGVSIAQLASASGIDPAEAADATALILASNNLAADSAKRIADNLAAAEAAGRTPISKMVSGMYNIGGSASAIGLSPEAQTAMLSVLGGTFTGAEAGTAVKRITENIRQSPLTKGMSFEGLTGEQTIQKLAGLYQKVQGIKDIERRQKVTTELFGEYSRAMIEFNNKQDEFLTVYNAQLNGAGAAAEAARIRTDTTSKKWQGFKTALSDYITSVLDSTDFIKNTLDFATNMLTGAAKSEREGVGIGSTIKENASNPLMTNPMTAPLMMLIKTLEKQKGVDVNIKVDQDGKVVSTNATGNTGKNMAGGK
jgi:TP901 family phage tail tape measure protein